MKILYCTFNKIVSYDIKCKNSKESGRTETFVADASVLIIAMKGSENGQDRNPRKLL